MLKKTGIIVLILSLAVVFHAGSLHAFTNSAGGYYLIDSNEPGGPIYAWEDISSTGTALSMDDDDAKEINMGFSFTYNGTAFSNAIIGSNGHIDFVRGGDKVNATGNYSWNESNLPIPQFSDDGSELNGWAMNPLIAPWFDDLDPFTSGEVFYKTAGSTPDRRFIVQWDTSHWDCKDPADTLSFQAILYEGTNGILFQYKDATSADTCIDGGLVSDGGSATIGLGLSNTVGLQYSANSPAITDGLAIYFGTESPFIVVSSDTVDFGYVPSSAIANTTITVQNKGLSSLLVNGVAWSDSLPAPFSIEGGTCAGAAPSNTVELTPGETCDIIVGFSPGTMLASGHGAMLYAGAGTAAGFMFFGIVFAGGVRKRRKIAALMAACALLGGMLLVSCGGGGGDEVVPPSKITYSDSFDISSDDPVRPVISVSVRGQSH